MTTEHFNLEMKRIYNVFGEKSFPHERVKMIWAHWKDLPDHAFTRITSKFISTLKTPPLPNDFIDASYTERRNAFNRDVQGAADIFNWSEQKGLRETLNENYPGCSTLADAVELQRVRNWGNE